MQGRFCRKERNLGLVVLCALGDQWFKTKQHRLHPFNTVKHRNPTRALLNSIFSASACLFFSSSSMSMRFVMSFWARCRFLPSCLMQCWYVIHKAVILKKFSPWAGDPNVWSTCLSSTVARVSRPILLAAARRNRSQNLTGKPLPAGGQAKSRRVKNLSVESFLNPLCQQSVA